MLSAVNPLSASSLSAFWSALSALVLFRQRDNFEPAERGEAGEQRLVSLCVNINGDR